MHVGKKMKFEPWWWYIQLIFSGIISFNCNQIICCDYSLASSWRDSFNSLTRWFQQMVTIYIYESDKKLELGVPRNTCVTCLGSIRKLTTGITPKILMQELWILCMDVDSLKLYPHMKFHFNSISWTWVIAFGQKSVTIDKGE